MNDLEHAQLAQKELEERAMREDELISRLRRDTSGFRRECDEFHAEFRSKRTMNEKIGCPYGKEKAD